MNYIVETEPNYLRKVKACFIFFFLLFLVLPLLQEKFQIFSYKPVVENRLKAKKPSGLYTIFLSGSTYAASYEKYFNDNYGLRDFLIRLKNQVDYSIFRLSDEVIVGKDGWLFYKNVYEKQMTAIEQGAAGLDKMFARILKINQLLKERGITLVVVPAPMKTTIYPEMLNVKYPRLPEISGFHKYREFLKSHPEIVSIDVQGILESLKPTMQVYHKTDFHWNDPAGAVAMKELIDRLGVLSGTGVTWNYPLKIRIDKQQGGGEINSLAVLRPPYEDMLMLDGSPAIGVGITTASGRPNEWVYTANDASPSQLLPPTVMYGDSFADAFLRAGLTYPFKEIRKFYNLELNIKFKEIPEGTKFVILEHIETNLLSMLTDAYWPPELR